MSAQNGGPAFPIPASDMQYNGLSIRDYFAAKAMQAFYSGILACGEPMTLEDDAVFAKRSYILADEMLKAREINL